MKVLVLGGSGMLGHKLWQVFAGRFDTFITVRHGYKYYSAYEIFDSARTVDRFSAEDITNVEKAIDNVKPEVVVNCIGVVKQSALAKDPRVSILVNSLFPHQLAGICQDKGIRLIHISTDCVFSGRKGNYTEDDRPDAEDLYGRSKLLGEIQGAGCLTLRASMIGRELETLYGLVEWFLSQEGKTVHGYTRSIFSGFTTRQLAEIISSIISRNTDLNGVLHVASNPISKYDLLELVKKEYGLRINIEPDDTLVCDRSLNADRFNRTTSFTTPTWSDMIKEMHNDPTPYAEIRRFNANR